MAIYTIEEYLGCFVEILQDCNDLSKKQKELLLKCAYKVEVHQVDNIWNTGDYTFFDEHGRTLVKLKATLIDPIENKLIESIDLEKYPTQNCRLTNEFWKNFDVYSQNKIMEGIEPLKEYFIPELIEKIKNRSYYCEIQNVDYESYMEIGFYDRNFEVVFRYEYYYFRRFIHDKIVIKHSGDLYSFHENIIKQKTPEEIEESRQKSIKKFEELVARNQHIINSNKTTSKKKKKGWFF